MSDSGPAAAGDFPSRNNALLVDDGADEEVGLIRQPLPTPKRKDVKSVKFLCFDLSNVSKPILFFLLSTGVIGFFILNSFLEEYFFRSLKNFKFGWYMTSVELACFTGFAIIERWARQSPQETVLSHIAPYSQHWVVAIAMTASRGLTNKSLEYLNYPTQVIFKSMKLITVMIGSIFMLKARFTLLEYVSAIALVASAILFSLGDVSETPELGSATGFIIVLASLVADAFHSNTQERLLKKHNATVTEAMLYTNGFAALLSFAWVVLTGELGPALAFCTEHPSANPLFAVRAAVIYLGVLCFVLIINTFGVVTATAITTVRKILTILVSFVLFPKPVSSRHVLGFVIFSAGIAVTIWDKRIEMQNKAATAAAAEKPAIQLANTAQGAKSNSVAQQA